MTTKDHNPAGREAPPSGNAMDVPASARQALRQRAEAIARGKAAHSPGYLKSLSPEETERMLHELHVHQIELEIQNEELRRAQLELDTTRARYFDLYDLAPVGYCSVDEKGLIVEANLTAATLLRVPRGALVKQPISRFILRDDQDIYYLRRKQLMETGQPQSYDLRMLRRDGTQFWAHLQSTASQQNDGAPEHRVVLNDISERKRLEEMYLRAQKLESLGKLAGGIAHDFNNILAAIRGNADLAAEDMGPDHIATESLKEIRKASVRAGELVRRLMAFGGPREAKQEVIDLSAVTGEVLKLLRSTLPAGIALKMDFAKGTTHVLADAGQVHEVIVNLTTNAVHAIGARGGSIEYRLEPVQVEEDLARSIPGLNPGRHARLTVKDSGCGMDAATVERIFDAFYTTKPQGEGTGLGLSMVHGIMRGHGGAATVESTPGKGSTFQLYFPAANEKFEKEEEENAQAQHLLSAGKRVLYVDDEEALVLLAERFLSRLGHRINGFTDPEVALEAFRAHPQDYDVVVTDLSMPRMSGFDLSRELLAVRPDTPVLMTTGYLRAEDERKARAAGVREIVLKPTTMDELARVLDRLFRASELAVKPAA